MSSTTGAATETPYWDHTSTNGWLYLLPPLATRSVLYLSTQSTLSASQARLCGDPTLVCDDQIADLQKPPAKNETAVRWCSVDELLADTTPRFDGVVIHDPAGKLLHRAHWPRVMQLLRHLRVVLRPSGFVYLGMQHAHSMRQLARRLLGKHVASTPKLLSVAAVRQDLRLAGYSHVAVHPYLMWGDKMAEVISSQGYRSTKNRESLRERLKEFVLGRLGSRFFAPSYGLVAYVGEPAQSTIDIVLGHVRANSKAPGGAPLAVKQHLVFPGDKAIVSVGAEHRPDEDVVAIIAGDALAIERRHAESATLAALAQLPVHLSRLIPKVMGQFSIGATSVFLLNRLSGVSLDIAVGALDEVTDRALDFIIELHRESAQTSLIDESTYASRFASLIEAAALRNPALAADLRELNQPLFAALRGLDVPAVLQHGDYKVENVLYDPRDRRVTGVIDWELATLHGLPLLDPLYLVIYNRQIRGDDGFDVLRQVLVDDQLSAAERASLERYVSAMRIPEALRLPLRVAFLVDHIGRRAHFSDHPLVTEFLGGLIRELRAALLREALPAT